ncbi:pyrimidine 5'-nucleotidase [Mitsuaria sp. WAJ17]|uniref:pyrimidine 5'-nucleotidase n=1 Tax=Mitsuaria sp. WAJ17 TaxID=2761452 RepID=UPI0016032AFC|nr:pyrimidine 5'-nucleotidase [Mitsuaria sp. WAJ17]MBB2486214.1 pyrimidine 5'-nucleotidase [Mitsuaria sp. WAJ17]
MRRPPLRHAGRARQHGEGPVWLFDLDNTLHNASDRVFAALNVAMTAYIERHLGVDTAQANCLRRLYWARYGATLTGLVRHHGIDAAHFLAETHALPGMEAHLHGHAHDLAALARLPGRKFLLTNGPAAYAWRVLRAVGLGHAFEGVIALEQMAMFGQLRPKPDRRMFRHVLARLRVQPTRCVLVEDSLMHQKAARSLGLRTVWVQRWTKASVHGPEAHLPLRRRPSYVDQRVHGLGALRWRALVHATGPSGRGFP